MSAFKENGFTISIQIDPPSTSNTLELFEDIEKLIDAGVSVVDINSSRRLSFDSIVLGCKLKGFGLEVIPHITTRDSLTQGMINNVFASYSLYKMKNYLIIGGDPYDTTKSSMPGVFQTNAAGCIKELHEKLRESSLAPDLVLGAALNQYDDKKAESKKIKGKIDAGADFFMSQPVFSKKQILETSEFYKGISEKPLLLGIWPLINMKTIENIYQGRITGVEIPEKVYQEAQRFKDDKALREWGFDQSSKLIKFLRSKKLSQGVYIVAPLRKPGQLVELLRSKD